VAVKEINIEWMGGTVWHGNWHHGCRCMQSMLLLPMANRPCPARSRPPRQ